MSRRCLHCHDEVLPPGRAEAGYRLCMTCGDQVARAAIRTIVPMHKSNYVVITDLADLKGINNKGGLHR